MPGDKKISTKLGDDSPELISSFLFIDCLFCRYKNATETFLQFKNAMVQLIDSIHQVSDDIFYHPTVVVRIPMCRTYNIMP